MLRPASRELRLGCLAYTTAAVFTFAAMEGVYWNVTWHDPNWAPQQACSLNPRPSYLNLYCEVGRILGPVWGLLLLFGLPLLRGCWRTRWRWPTLIAFGMLLALCLHL